MSSEQEPSALQKAFDVFTKYGGSNEGKLSLEGVKQWLQNSGVIGEKDSQISAQEANKCLPESAQDNGMTFNQFHRYIQDIAKEKGIDANSIEIKLSSAIPTQVSEKLKDVKAKLSGK